MRAFIDARVRRQSYIFGAASASLVLIGFSILALHQQASTAAAIAWKYLHSRQRYTAYRTTFDDISNSRDTQRAKISALEAEREQLGRRELSLNPAELDRLNFIKQQLGAFQSSTAELRHNYSAAFRERTSLASKVGSDYDKLSEALEAVKVPFRISDFELPLSYRYAALAWQWLTVAGAAYLLYSRRFAIAFHAHILRVLKLDPAFAPGDVDDPPVEAPFWLAPLPTRDGISVGHADLRGWLRMSRGHTWTILACWVGTLWFFYYAASTQAAVLIVRSVRGGYELFPSLLWSGAVGAMTCIAVLWFWPFRVEEWPQPPGVPEVAPRRKVLRVILAAGFAAPAAAFLAGLTILPWSRRAPRFFHALKLDTPATWPSGFYLNPKSRIVHFLDKTRRFRYLTNRGKTHLVAYSFAPEATPERLPRVNFSTFSYAYEAAALRELQANNWNGAIELLFRAVTQDVAANQLGRKRSLRLYDLLAGLIVRWGGDHEMNRLRHLLLTDRGRPEINSRLVKWDDPTSTWYQRWRNAPTVRWNTVTL